MRTSNRTPRFLLIPLAKVIASFLFVFLPTAAQQVPGPATHLGDKYTAENHLDSSRVELLPQSLISNDRLFYALPNFLTVESSANLQPLTTRQKFNVVARSSFYYFEVPWYAFRAGISQAQDSESAYGRSAAGYGKRFALTFADCTIENFMVGAVLPSLLHQDPRFYRSGQGTFWHRTGYAVSRILVTRSDSGREQFNFFEILGSALAAGISTYSYHPAYDRTFRNVASGWGTQVAFHTLTLVLKELWPDLRRKISHNPHPDVTAR